MAALWLEAVMVGRWVYLRRRHRGDQKHLHKHGTEPTLENVKRHLVHHVLLPTEMMNEPERSIILRAKSAV